MRARAHASVQFYHVLNIWNANVLISRVAIVCRVKKSEKKVYFQFKHDSQCWWIIFFMLLTVKDHTV